jgi:hypothetical protein
MPILLIFVAIFTLRSAKNYSKSILRIFIINEGVAAKTNAGMLAINANLYSSLLEVDDVQQTLPKIKASSNYTYNFIENYKQYLIRALDQYDINSSEIIRLRNVQALDNYDIPSSVLIGSDPTAPNKGEMSSYALKIKLKEHLALLHAYTNNENTKKSLNLLLNCEYETGYSGIVESWEVGQFCHVPLAVVITTLTSLQSSVLIDESLVLNKFNK